MANGWIWDCLLGMITSFIGQNIDILNAVVCAAYIQGYIGDSLSKELYTVNATDIIRNISKFIQKIKFWD